MARLHYQHVFDELEAMRNYMDSLFQQIQETSPLALLPASEEPSQKLLPGVPETLKVTVIEYEYEVVITAELIPGDLKRDITIDLIHSRALKIASIHREWKKEDKKGYSMCEHSYGYISQIIPIPVPVIEEGSTASIKKGILEVHLKRSIKESNGLFQSEF